MLEVEHLNVAYGEVVAVRDVSLNVGQGEIVTLIGGNGAGKTTTLRTISGLIRPRSGDIRFEGGSIAGLPPDRIVALGIAQVPEGRHVFPELSIEDNLKVGAHLVRDRDHIRDGLERVYAMFPSLLPRRRQLGGTLSGGEQQMLVLGRAIMSRPRLLLLDEPSLGLAPRIVEDVAKAIVSMRKAGMTILLVEQNARVALAIAGRGYVIETGRVVLADTAEALRRNPKIVDSYLGGRAAAEVATMAAAGSPGSQFQTASL
jgi:branched-chain amino acid transport system ATP-binding protein